MLAAVGGDHHLHRVHHHTLGIGQLVPVKLVAVIDREVVGLQDKLQRLLVLERDDGRDQPLVLSVGLQSVLLVAIAEMDKGHGRAVGRELLVHIGALIAVPCVVDIVVQHFLRRDVLLGVDLRPVLRQPVHTVAQLPSLKALVEGRLDVVLHLLYLLHGRRIDHRLALRLHESLEYSALLVFHDLHFVSCREALGFEGRLCGSRTSSHKGQSEK